MQNKVIYAARAIAVVGCAVVLVMMSRATAHFHAYGWYVAAALCLALLGVWAFNADASDEASVADPVPSFFAGMKHSVIMTVAGAFGSVLIAALVVGLLKSHDGPDWVVDAGFGMLAVCLGVMTWAAYKVATAKNDDTSSTGDDVLDEATTKRLQIITAAADSTELAG